MHHNTRVLVLGRLAFCSMECFTAALETELRPRPVRINPMAAAAMQCYCCGEYLAELEGDR